MLKSTCTLLKKNLNKGCICIPFNGGWGPVIKLMAYNWKRPTTHHFKKICGSLRIKVISTTNEYHTWWKSRPNEIATPTIRKDMDFCIQIFILRDALKETCATILENKAFPSTFYIFKSQTLKYPRFNYSCICPSLKIWKLLKRFTQTLMVKFLHCKTKCSEYLLSRKLMTCNWKDMNYKYNQPLYISRWAKCSLCTVHTLLYTARKELPMCFSGQLMASEQFDFPYDSDPILVLLLLQSLPRWQMNQQQYMSNQNLKISRDFVEQDCALWTEEQQLAEQVAEQRRTLSQVSLLDDKAFQLCQALLLSKRHLTYPASPRFAALMPKIQRNR